ncbi:MAG: hypothetical protein ACRCUT_09090 [Spirochaetota bacterium]
MKRKICFHLDEQPPPLHYEEHRFKRERTQGTVTIMGKSQDAKKETKKQPLKTAKEKKLEKQVKKNSK